MYVNSSTEKFFCFNEITGNSYFIHCNKYFTFLLCKWAYWKGLTILPQKIFYAVSTDQYLDCRFSVKCGHDKVGLTSSRKVVFTLITKNIFPSNVSYHIAVTCPSGDGQSRSFHPWLFHLRNLSQSITHAPLLACKQWSYWYIVTQHWIRTSHSCLRWTEAKTYLQILLECPIVEPRVLFPRRTTPTSDFFL